jgi:GNAT superfamily N-acetyltransferase
MAVESVAFEVSMEKSRLDVDMIHAFLVASYWASGRSRAVVERSIANSVCFGGYIAGRQVAFGRAVTDTVVMAWLADVFVLPAWRRQGHATTLVAEMLRYLDGTEVKASMLRTRDAEALYERFGFQAIAGVAGMMRRVRPTGG